MMDLLSQIIIWSHQVFEFSGLVQKMKRIIPFSNYSERDLLKIVQAGAIKRYPVGKTIFYEEDPNFGLCVLLKGEVHLYKMGPEGQENIMAIIKPVIMFNEIAAIDGGVNPDTAIAFKNCTVWRANPCEFQEGLRCFPEMGLGLLPILAKRNRELVSKYSDLSFRPVRERVALLLLNLIDNGQIKIERKHQSIQQMAAHISTSPVVISRILGDFREEGLIESDRVTIEILQPEKLYSLTLIEIEPALP